MKSVNPLIRIVIIDGIAKILFTSISMKRKKYKDKYTRNYSFIKLFDNPFSPEEIKIEYHHINNIFVIPLPEQIHKKNCGHDTEKHRMLCEQWIQKNYCLNIEKIFSP